MLLSIPVIFILVIFLDLFLAIVTDNEEVIASEWTTILISFGLAAYALRLYFREFIDGVHRMGIRKFIVAAAVGSVLILSLSVLGGLIHAEVAGDLLSQNQESVSTWAATFLAAAFLRYAVCVPIFEETIFRYILQGWLRGKFKKGGAFFAVIISGTLFALVHVATPADLIQYLPVALLLGTIYEKTRCISLTICIHSVYNLIVLVIQSM